MKFISSLCLFFLYFSLLCVAFFTMHGMVKAEDLTTSNLNTVAFRIPDKTITLKLLENLNYPLAAPSANIFGYISPTKTEHIHKNFNKGIDYLLEGGNCKLGLESTIIGFKDDKIIVYRLGSLVLNELKKIGRVKVLYNNYNYPGSFKNHYSPRKKLYLGNIKNLCKIHKDKKIGILCYDKKYEEVKYKNQIILSDKSSLDEASKNLYSALYKLDNMRDIDIIISSLMPNNLIGRTINDRLTKSAE